MSERNITVSVNTSRLENEVRRLRAEVAEQTEEVQVARDKIIGASAKLAIVGKYVDVQAGAEHAKQEHTALQQKEAQLEDDQQRIRQEYAKIQADLENQQMKAEKALTGHIAPLRQHLQTAIEGSLKMHARPMQQSSRVDAERTCMQRKTLFAGLLRRIRESIEKFLARRNEFVNQVDRKRHSMQTRPADAESVDIPAWIVTAIDENGNRVKRIFALSERAAKSDGRSVKFEIRPWDGGEEVREMLASKLSQSSNQPTKSIEKSKLRRAIDDLANRGLIADGFFRPFTTFLSQVVAGGSGSAPSRM